MEVQPIQVEVPADQGLAEQALVHVVLEDDQACLLVLVLAQQQAALQWLLDHLEAAEEVEPISPHY